jgi:hypothetical protein
MIKDARGYDVVVDFWEWYQRREARYNPLASYALDKCEEMSQKRQWDSFGYWHTIYLRERRKASNSRRAVPGLPCKGLRNSNTGDRN